MTPIATVHWTKDDREYSESFWSSDRLKSKIYELHEQDLSYVVCMGNLHTPLPFNTGVTPYFRKTGTN